VGSKPLSLLDCDLPIQTAGPSSSRRERARHMKQKPFMSSTIAPKGALSGAAVKPWMRPSVHRPYRPDVLRGFGLTSKDIDIFNPYDGFTLFFHIILKVSIGMVSSGGGARFLCRNISVEARIPLFQRRQLR